MLILLGGFTVQLDSKQSCGDSSPQSMVALMSCCETKGLTVLQVRENTALKSQLKEERIRHTSFVNQLGNKESFESLLEQAEFEKRRVLLHFLSS